MKKFVLKGGLFAIILGIILSGSYIANDFLIRNTSFKLRDEVVTIITGNSSTQYGLNPDYLSYTENISLESEPLFMSYYKLKEILSNNNHIQHVIIPFSFLDVRESKDSYLNLFDDIDFKRELYSRFCCLQEQVPYSCLMEFNVDNIMYLEAFLRYRVFVNFIYLVRKLRCDNFERTYLNHIGQFKKMVPISSGKFTPNTEEYIDNAIAAKFSSEGLETKYSTYLDSIVNLCCSLDKLVIIINTPSYPEFNDRIPYKFKAYYYEKIGRFKKSSFVHFLDCSDLITDHDYFIDEIHLNCKGAEIFSKELALRLNEISNNRCVITSNAIK